MLQLGRKPRQKIYWWYPRGTTWYHRYYRYDYEAETTTHSVEGSGGSQVLDQNMQTLTATFVPSTSHFVEICQRNSPSYRRRTASEFRRRPIFPSIPITRKDTRKQRYTRQHNPTRVHYIYLLYTAVRNKLPS